MGSKEKILKNKLFWASAAIASSLLFSQLVLGTPVSVSADTNESTSTQSTQNQAAAFHDMNQHSNESGAGMPNTNDGSCRRSHDTLVMVPGTGMPTSLPSPRWL